MSHIPSARPRLLLSRRAVVAGVLGVGLAGTTGCELVEMPASSGDDEEPSPPPVDPDVALATEVVAALGLAVDRLSATTRRHAALTGRLAPLSAAHRAHLAALSDAVPSRPTASDSTPSPVPAVPGGRVKAVQEVLQGERELGHHLQEAALRAASGPFARVLASAAASTAQHVAALTSSGVQQR